MLRIEWVYSLNVSPVDSVGIHEVLHAFFRTSEYGEWRADPVAASDSFVLRYLRGRWRRSFFGLGKTLIPSGSRTETLENVPLRLAVTIRPAPENYRIGLRYRLVLVLPWSSSFRRDDEQRIAEATLGEVKALSSYLREVYGWTETPQITQDG